MIHPHENELEKYTTQEIESKVVKLNRLYFQTTNPSVQDQMVMLIDGYKLELEVRQVAAQKKAAEQQNGLDNLINVS